MTGPRLDFSDLGGNKKKKPLDFSDLSNLQDNINESPEDHGLLSI